MLVVDDEPDARDLIKRVLAECDAHVLAACSADEALMLVEAENPHVLVSDIGMPDVDGYELLRRVRALGPTRGGNVPAIALTAFARSEDRTRALHAGFLVHVSKPVEPSELVATVAVGQSPLKAELNHGSAPFTLGCWIFHFWGVTGGRVGAARGRDPARHGLRGSSPSFGRRSTCGGLV